MKRSDLTISANCEPSSSVLLFFPVGSLLPNPLVSSYLSMVLEMFLGDPAVQRVVCEVEPLALLGVNSFEASRKGAR